MKHKIYYRESRWFALILAIMIVMAIALDARLFSNIILIGLFIVTIIQNETKPVKPKRTKK